jgi:hypothetical protein
MSLEAIEELGKKFKIERFFINAIRVLLSALAFIPVVVYTIYLFSWHNPSEEGLVSYLVINGWYVLVATAFLILVNLIMNWLIERVRRSFGKRAYRETPWFSETHLSETTTGCEHFFNNRGELIYRDRGSGNMFAAMHFMNRLAHHFALPCDIFAHLLIPYGGEAINSTFISLLALTSSGLFVFDLKFWDGNISIFDTGGYWYARDSKGNVYPLFINDDETIAALNALCPSIHENDITVCTVLMHAGTFEVEGDLPSNRHIFLEQDLSRNIRRYGMHRVDNLNYEIIHEALKPYRFPDDETLCAYRESHLAKEEMYRRLLTQG